jgi:hypothetical protein
MDDNIKGKYRGLGEFTNAQSRDGEIKSELKLLFLESVDQ